MKHKNKDGTFKLGPDTRAKIIIPNFIFADGSTGTFTGYDRGRLGLIFINGTIKMESSRSLWKMNVYDDQPTRFGGNYFVIDIDTRKKSQSKEVTFILDGIAFYHPITNFATYNAEVNPENGILLMPKKKHYE